MAKDSRKKRTAQPALFENPFRMVPPGLAALRINFGTVCGLVLAPPIVSLPFFFLLVVLATYFSTHGQHGGGTATFTAVSAVLYLTLLALAVLVAFGLVLVTLRSADGEKTRLREVLRLGLRSFWRFTGLLVCVVLVVAAGLVLLVVPGVIMLKRYFLAPFYMADQNLGVFEAMRRSADETAETGGVWSILAAFVALSALSLIPGVGWFLALAATVLYICVPAIRYREIQNVLAARAKRAAPSKPTDLAPEEAAPQPKTAQAAKAVPSPQATTSRHAKPKFAHKQSRRERKSQKTTDQ
ncbi:MAG TPA: hypothetical protein VLF71_04830 [Candidatus Saccharimonadales bacterium]|nr:hypothetical protein [Candidatus Saccharimonadales bacterium]